MKKENSYLDHVMEKLKPHGPIRSRAMFGGYGIYYEKVIFASLAENQLYFRVDEYNRKDFEGYDSKPFIYMGLAKPITLPYLTLPEEILENQKELPKWIKKACQASLRYKKHKEQKTKKKNF